MKKLVYLIVLALILGLVLTGCSLLSNISQVPTTEQSGIINLTKGASGEITLYAGQDIPVGTVNVSNDGTNLYVTYNTIDGWVMTETHLAVADSLDDIPQTKKGNPIPGQFPYKHEDLGYTASDPYIIPLSEIDVGVGAEDILYIAAHAKVIRPIEGCYETVWQIGDVEEDKTVIPYDEFNYPEQVTGTQDFYVDTTPTTNFPYFSDPPDYAPIINIHFNAEMLLGGRFLFSWSPGNSGTETIEVSLDGTKLGEVTRSGANSPSDLWWKNQERFIDSFDVPATEAGDHVLTINVTAGNGLVWDWIRFEKPCVQEESTWAGFAVGEMPFDGKNWATYFTYTVQLPQDGMVLWLDAGKGITASGVSKWEDQSGNGNDATQANPSYQPIYVENALNFRPVVRFIGGEKYLRHSPILTSDYTAFYVLKLTESEKNLLYYYHAGNVNAGDLGFFAENENKAEGWGSVGLPDVRTSIVHPTLDDWRIHTHQPEALHKDGVEISYARNQNVYAAGLTDIGSRSDHATLYFVGDIAEILVYNRILSDSEREFVETYLNAKYNIY